MSKHQKTCKLGQTVDKDEKDEENGIRSKSHQAVQNHHLELIGFDNFNSPPVISVPNMFGRYSLPPFQQTDLSNLKASLEFVLRKERSMLWVWTPEMVGDGGRWVRLRQPLPCFATSLPQFSHRPCQTDSAETESPHFFALCFKGVCAPFCTTLFLPARS